MRHSMPTKPFRRIACPLLVALLATGLTLPLSASGSDDSDSDSAQSDRDDAQSYRHEIIVRVHKDDLKEFENTIDKLGLDLEDVIRISDDERLAQVFAPDGVDIEQLASDLGGEPGVSSASSAALTSLPEQTDGIFLDQSTMAILDALDNKDTVRFGGEGNEVWTGYANQPAARLLELSGVPEKVTGKGAVVAVIDTGVDHRHDLLKESLLEGYDFLLDKAGFATDRSVLDQSTMAILDQSTMAILDQSTMAILDQSTMAILDQSTMAILDAEGIELPPALGHGTLVAGLVHLVAPEAKILPLRVFDGYGVASLFDIIHAIYYAIDRRVTVINMSFHLEYLPDELKIAVETAEKEGIVVVGAAGNHGESAVIYPAAMGKAIGVGATDEADFVASFSNHGDSLVTVTAPGVSVITSWFGGGWAAVTGTSFSAPFVSGAVALIADKLGNGGPSEKAFDAAVKAFESSDEVQGNLADEVGFGRLNLRRAIRNAQAP